MIRFLTLFFAASSAAGFLSPVRQQQTIVRTTPLVAPSIASTETARLAVLQPMDIPEKLYDKKTKEMPKILGGLKIGLREIVVVTGASSGLGLNTAAELAKSGKYFVVMAVRDVEKAKQGR